MAGRANEVTDDPEEVLKGLTARGASSDLRQRILDQIGQKLPARNAGHWQRWVGPAVAASIALAFGGNVWITHRQEARLAGICGQPAIPDDFREAVAIAASVTDRETAHLLEQRLMAASRPKPSFAENIRVIEKYFRDLNSDWKENHREKIQENPEDRSARSGIAPGLVAHCECHFYLDHGFPARETSRGDSRSRRPGDACRAEAAFTPA
jgi:hypothetical protein